MKNISTTKLVLIYISLFSTISLADISINTTRLIYPSDKKEVTFTINNAGKKASLVQTWVDEGNPKDTPDNTNAPFLLSPPISVLQAAKAQNIRVRFTGEVKLPEDKESLFWVNVLEVPQNLEDVNQLRIGVRSRIKFFYRPISLSISPEDAPKQIKWEIKRKNGKWYTNTKNTTPYYITFLNITINTKDVKGKVELVAKNSMLAPSGEGEFEIIPQKEVAKEDVHFSIINDYGGSSEFDSKLTE